MGTKNLGQVQAIWIGTIPPINTSMLWYDINTGVNLHKYYKTSTSSWEPFVLNSATAPLMRNGDSIILVFNADQFEISGGALKIKDNVLQSVLPTIAISDITGLQNVLDNKVTAVVGKSLMSDEEIERLSTVRNYTHPATHDPSIISQNESNRFVTDVQIESWNGKQDALGFTPYPADNPDGYLKRSDLTNIASPIYTITLPAASLVASRIPGAVFGSGAEGFVLSVAGDSPNHLIVTHNIGREIVDVKIKSTETSGITGKRILQNSAPYSGLIATDNNTLRIENLTTVEKEIMIHLIFA